MLTGTEKGMQETFGRCVRAAVAFVRRQRLMSRCADRSTCHGAGRARSRNNSRNKLEYQVRLSLSATVCSLTRHARFAVQEVLDALKTKGISIRVASPKLVMEEAPESYKDVTQVRTRAAAVRPTALTLRSQVVDTCHSAGISKKTVKLRPIAVIKG